MSIKNNINSLGIPKSHYCPHCGMAEAIPNSTRWNLANCMMANGAGLWALYECGSCGWTEKLYPIKINGIDCTPEECDALTEEIKRYDAVHGGGNQ